MSIKHVVTATVYDKKGRVLAVARNNYQKTHPMMAEIAAKIGGRYKERIFLHAEVNAIIKALKHGTPYKIKVERYKADGRPGNAAPCLICQEAIKMAGIKVVEYTVG